MLHAFKKRLLPARYREKPAEIWIACNPVALTNCDPHEFDLPIKEIKGVNNPANFMMKAVGGAAFCRDRNYALGMQ